MPESPDDRLGSVWALYERQRFGQAERECREIVRSDRGNSEAVHTLGLLASRREDWRAATRLFRRALAAGPPAQPQYYNSLALALLALGRTAGAVDVLNGARRTFPDCPDLAVHHAKILADMGRFADAIPALKDALALAGRQPPVLRRLAEALQRAGRFSESEIYWRELVEIDRRNGAAENNLGGVLCRQGRVLEGHKHFRRAMRLGYAIEAGSNLLLTSNYRDGIPPSRIFQEHLAWAKRVESAPVTAAPRPPVSRPLRVGYVSSDFRRHSVACFFEPLLENHDTRSVEVHCFSNDTRSDKTTDRLMRLAAWHDISRLTDDRAFDAIRRARIDILVDLNGHTAGHRLAVFARKPAPVQVTYLGYPNTTGLSAIDYRFTDSIADPPGAADGRHSETLVRIDPCFLCYRPPRYRVSAGPLPYRFAGHLTFACFAIREKLSDAVLEAWAVMMNRAPKVRLLLKAAAFADPVVCAGMTGFFERRGVDPSRIGLHLYSHGKGQHLSYYRQVDLMLDPYPYNGTAATAEALWAGVPVLTWAGKTHVSRVGATLLTQLGLDDLIGPSGRDYIEKAVMLAHAPDRLEAWRGSLRRRMRSSSLMDGAGLARTVEACYREMWRA